MEHILNDKESLSDKEKSSFSDIDELRNNDNINFYHEEDVKKFIKDLKEIITDNGNTFGACTLRHSAEEIMKVHNELTRIIFQIDKLAGDKLV